MKKQRALKQDEKDRARSVPFFARYLAGQEEGGAESADGADSVRRRTLKFPSDWDDDDWAR